MMTKKSNLSLARQAVVALSVAAMAMLCLTATAQNTDDDDRVSQAHHADVSSLKGKELDYKKYKEYISTGRPWDNNKMFLLYNVGAKKFLNLGSYWGTHAALSEVPRQFWLQRRNEKHVQGQWSYKRFPEGPDENAGLFSNDFFNLKAVEVGNTEGSKRAHATYKYVRKVQLDGTDSTDIVKSDTQCDGGSFTYPVGIDFNKEKIVACIDMSKCQATSSGGGKMETLFSVGTDIANWGVTKADGTTTSKLHIYGYRQGGKSYVRVQVMDTQYKDETHKSGSKENPIDIGDDNLVTIVISQQSILVNGVQCMPRTQQAYESALAPFLKQTTMRVGSTQGDTYTSGFYNYVTLTKTSIYDSDPTHVLRPDVALNGRKFYKEFSGTLADKQIEATIDLSTCKDGNTGTDGQNVLSIGGDIAQRYTATAQNLHFYYNGTTLTLEGVSSTHTGGDTDPTIKWSKNVEGTVTIKANRTGVYVDGVLADGFGPDNDIVSYLTNTAPAIQVGSLQGGTRSWATYKSVEVKTEETNVVAPGYKSDGITKWGKQYVGTLADKQVEATIDLHNCTSDSENVLSVGTDISEWGVTSSGYTSYNIHFYYPDKNMSTEKRSYVEVDPAAGSNKYRKHVKIADEKMHVVLNKTGLWIDGNLIISPDNEIVAYLLNNAEHIQVGSKEGNTRSHATYTSLTVSAYSSETATEAAASPLAQAAAKAAKAAPAATGIRRAAEASGEQGSTTYIFKDKQGDGTKFWSEPFEVSFADGDKIAASVCLDKSTCNKYEDIISIGTDIDQWGNRGNMHNVHFYYMGDSTVSVKQGDGKYIEKPCKVVQAVYVNKDHSDDTKRAVYVTEDADGHYTMTIELSKDGLIVNGTNIYPAMDPMPDLPYSKYEDRAGDIVRIKQDQWGNRLLDGDGHYIIADDDDDNAHGVYVTNNGYIYTDESRTKKELPLFITSYFEQESTASGNEDNYLSWAPFLTNNDKWGTVGVFADRALPSAELDTDQNKECAQWFFEPTAATDASEQGHNTYRVYLKMKNVKRHIRTADGQKDTETVAGTNKFYLQASTDYVYGNGLEDYAGDPAITDVTLAEASEKLPTEADKADYAVWKLIDIAEYYSLFDSPESEMTSMLDLTYTMRDPDFTRENYELSRWHMDKDSLLSSDPTKFNVRIGYDHFSKKTLTDTDYTDEQGRNADKYSDGTYKNTPSDQFLAVRQRTNNHARYMGVDVRNEGYGRFFQDVTVYNPGWYAVSCGGMTTVGAQLFVQMKKSDGSYATPVYQSLHTLTQGELKFLNATNHGWPFDQVDASHPMPMYNALVAMNDRNITGKVITDDGVLKTIEGSTAVLADNYTSQVAFFVDPSVLPSGGLTLRVGVEIPKGPGDGTQTLADDTEATATGNGAVGGRWTVFDNFHLMFGGKAVEPNLILDEDSTNLDYIERSLHIFDARPLRLHRTFKSGWNTLILPVDLTKGDILKVFGQTAVLAELESLTANTIEFKSVTAKDSSDVMLHAFKPYIIKVDAEHVQGNGKDGNGQPYSALLARRGDSNKFDKVKIHENHFYFESVNLAGKHLDDKTQQYYYSFAADTDGKQQQLTFGTATAHTAGKLYAYRDDHLATRTDPDAEGKLGLDNLRAYGTLCMNYKKAGTVLDGHHTLHDGYVMNGNNLYKIKNQYGTKGFRCWFASDGDTAGQLASNTKVSIDGIVDGTTGIADIYGDTGTPVVARFADGVYTIDGRKVRGGTSLYGLPAGVYIVGGRKTVVGM